MNCIRIEENPIHRYGITELHKIKLVKETIAKAFNGNGLKLKVFASAFKVLISNLSIGLYTSPAFTNNMA